MVVTVHNRIDLMIRTRSRFATASSICEKNGQRSRPSLMLSVRARVDIEGSGVVAVEQSIVSQAEFFDVN